MLHKDIIDVCLFIVNDAIPCHNFSVMFQVKILAWLDKGTASCQRTVIDLTFYDVIRHAQNKINHQ